MTYLGLLASLFLVDLLAAATPGPNFVIVSQAAMQQSRWQAIVVAAGVTLGSVAWAVTTMMGLTALFEFAPWLYTAIKIAGGLYLIYLGYSLWRSTAELAQEIDRAKRRSLGGAFLRGALTSLANPKSAIYFASVFAQFMNPDTPTWVLAAALVVVTSTSLIWYGTVILGLSNNVSRLAYAKAKRIIDRVTGSVMIGFGARLALAQD